MTESQHISMTCIAIMCEALERCIPVKPHKYIAYDGIERNGCPRCFDEHKRNEIL